MIKFKYIQTVQKIDKNNQFKLVFLKPFQQWIGSPFFDVHLGTPDCSSFNLFLFVSSDIFWLL